VEKRVFDRIQKTDMRRKSVAKTKKRTNKRIVITFPDDIKEQFPEIVKRITSLSPKKRGKIIVYTFIMAGIALKDPNAEKIIQGRWREEENKKEKPKKKVLKYSEALKDNPEGIEEI